MTSCKIKLVIIVLVLFIAGCTKKDDLTLPVKIHLKIGEIGSSIGSNDFSSPYFSITEVRIGIQRIYFEGIREAGGDIFFETDPEINLPTFEFGGQYNVPIADFDIPQGIYSTFKWDLNLKKITVDELIDSDDIDLLNTGLIIKGDYWYYNWYIFEPPDDWIPSIPFILTIKDAELFSFKNFYANLKPNIVLTENKDYEVILFFDLSYAFEPISRESFEAAEISGDSLNQMVIISRNKNEHLYEILLDRLARSTFIYVY